MRIKSALTATKRAFVIDELAHYKQNKKVLAAYRLDNIPSPTPKYERDGSSTHNSESRPNENLAIRLMTDPYYRALSQRIDAIDYVLGRASKEDTELIELTFIRGTHTIEGAGLKLNMSRNTAYRHVNAILVAIAVEMNLIPPIKITTREDECLNGLCKECSDGKT